MIDEAKEKAEATAWQEALDEHTEREEQVELYRENLRYSQQHEDMRKRIDVWLATADLEDIENRNSACETLVDEYGVQGDFACLFHSDLTVNL